MSNKAIINLVTQVKNGNFVTIEKLGDAKLRKTGNPLRESVVQKLSRFQVRLGCDTQQLEIKIAWKEGREARTIGPLPWGEYLADGLPVIKHKDALYIRGYWVKAFGSEYTVDGKPATPDQLAIIKQFGPKNKLKSSAPMCIKFDGIKRISGGGKVVTQ